MKRRCAGEYGGLSCKKCAWCSWTPYTHALILRQNVPVIKRLLGIRRNSSKSENIFSAGNLLAAMADVIRLPSPLHDMVSSTWRAEGMQGC